MSVDPLKVHKPEELRSSRASLSCNAPLQWLLEDSITHPVHHGTELEPLVCGSEGFGRIAADIEAARGSVLLICWGFDPGMALVRNKHRPQWPWTAGEPYGELLRRKAEQGVKVRLLVWYSKHGSPKQNSLVGYVTPDAYIVGSHEDRKERTAPFPHDIPGRRRDYCIRWWQDATSGLIPNLEVRGRDGDVARVCASIDDETDPPSRTSGPVQEARFSERKLLEEYATHHQKPVLIDYDHAGGALTVGYVMGLNSLTDYWDTPTHGFDGTGREIDWLGQSDPAAKACVSPRNPAVRPISRRPLRDYAMRVRGEALRDVWRNFALAWNRASLLPKLESRANGNAHARLGASLDPALIPAALRRGGKMQLPPVQIVRTQPEETHQDSGGSKPFDKSIKRAYFLATSQARNYLYIENQYFFYAEWARMLIKCRQDFMEGCQAGGLASSNAKLLHLFVVVPEPEDAGMLPRTFDTLKTLGQGDSMPNQKKEYEESWGVSDMHALATSAKAIKEPTVDKEGALMLDKKSLGLKVLVVKLVSRNPEVSPRCPATHRDIYIHSKLMMADDHFVMVGSANLNQRSMAVDSEMNVSTENEVLVRGLRQRAWADLTDGESTGGDGSPEKVVATFKQWHKLASRNATSAKKGDSLSGLIVKFRDERTADYRHG